MLKIKDDVDLKVLKKLGFDYNKEVDEYVYDINEEEILTINVNTRQIQLFIADEYWMCATQDNSFDLLFDLMLLGIVEKVSKV